MPFVLSSMRRSSTPLPHWGLLLPLQGRDSGLYPLYRGESRGSGRLNCSLDHTASNSMLWTSGSCPSDRNPRFNPYIIKVASQSDKRPTSFSGSSSPSLILPCPPQAAFHRRPRSSVLTCCVPKAPADYRHSPAKLFTVCR